MTINRINPSIHIESQNFNNFSRNFSIFNLKIFEEKKQIEDDSNLLIFMHMSHGAYSHPRALKG